MVAPEFSVANPSFESIPTKPYMNIPNNERSPDTAVNIQQGHMPSRSNTRAPWSPSYSPIDSFPPSEEDFTERMAVTSNRMDFEVLNHEMEGLYSLPPHNNTLQHPPQNEAASSNVV